MAIATNEQIQQFVNQRVRPRSEQIRSLLNSMKDDIASIGDVYEALASNNNPNNWEDNRIDGPPHLVLDSDVLAWNTFITNMVTAIEANPQLPIILKACVRPVSL